MRVPVWEFRIQERPVVTGLGKMLGVLVRELAREVVAGEMAVAGAGEWAGGKLGGLVKVVESGLWSVQVKRVSAGDRAGEGAVEGAGEGLGEGRLNLDCWGPENKLPGTFPFAVRKLL